MTVTVDNDDAPAVAMTAPAASATVSGSSVVVSANASDDVAVLGVQFLLDGSPLGAEDTVAPYTITWDTRLTVKGVHVLSARARDGVGQQTTSAPVSVTVAKTAPIVTWATPAGIVYGTVLSATQLTRHGERAGKLRVHAAGWRRPAGRRRAHAVGHLHATIQPIRDGDGERDHRRGEGDTGTQLGDAVEHHLRHRARRGAVERETPCPDVRLYPGGRNVLLVAAGQNLSTTSRRPTPRTTHGQRQRGDHVH